jgi:hypothetical protein
MPTTLSLISKKIIPSHLNVAMTTGKANVFHFLLRKHGKHAGIGNNLQKVC